MAALQHSQPLKFQVMWGTALLEPSVKRFFSELTCPERLGGYLRLLHQIVRASVPLMVEARDLARKENSARLSRLADYLDRHIEEERYHDEWLLNDLGIIGYVKEQVLTERPSTAIASLVGSQYYWIRHYTPFSILGYMAVLECHPTSVAELRRIAQNAQVPESVLSTLIHHAHIDGDHCSELFDVIHSLDLNRVERLAVRRVALEALGMLREIFEEASGQLARRDHV